MRDWPDNCARSDFRPLDTGYALADAHAILVAVPVLRCALFWLVENIHRSLVACLARRNSSAAAFVILLVLGFNRTQVIHARQERVFFAELQSAVARDRLAGSKFPRRYFIELAQPAPFLPVLQLADPYAHTILGRDVTFRITDKLPEQSETTTSLVWKDRRLLRAPLGLPNDPLTAPHLPQEK